MATSASDRGAPSWPPAAPAGGRRVVSPRLVGRESELARLVTAVLAPPSVVVLEGEAGVGKSRLISELRASPQLAGRHLAVGECRRIREPFPLGPVLEAVRQLDAALALVELSPVAGALRPLLPEIADRLPPDLPPLLDPAADRHRIFRALISVFTSLGSTLLVLEDLHWVDPHTVDFLHYLLAEPPPALSLVLTFRGEEVSPAVRALTARLPPEVTREHIPVPPLDPVQTGTLAAAILGTDRISEEFAHHLCARASGLPLVVEELLALLRARGTLVPWGTRWARLTLDRLDVPTGIRDSVWERVGRLPASGRSVVEAAAVLQLPVPVEVLAATADPDQARPGLVQALASSLLVEQGDRVGFRHALAMQAVYEAIPLPRRLDLHARAAAALTALDPPPLGQIAHHLRQAGEVTKWVAAAESAADQAIELGDPEEAVRLLGEVLRAGGTQGVKRARLAIKLGWASIRALHSPAPDLRDLLSTVLAEEPELPAGLRGELWFLVALQCEQVGDVARERQAYLAALPDLANHPELRAWAMMGLAVPRVPDVPAAEHRQWLDRTLQTLPSITDPALRVSVRGKAAMLMTTTGDRRWRRLTAQVRRDTGDRPRDRREVNAYYSIGVEACYAGHHRIAEQLLNTALAAAVEREIRMEELRIRSAAAVLAYCRGAWEGLADTATELRQLLTNRHRLQVEQDVVGAGLALARGALDRAGQWLTDIIARAETDLDLLPIPMTGYVRWALARGLSEQAVAVLEGPLAAWERKGVWPPAFRVLPVAVEAMVAAGERERAGRLWEDWTAQARGVDAPLATAATEYARAVLVAADHHWGVAAERFLAAAERYDALLCPYEAAQAREYAARCLIAEGDDRAAAVLGAALAGYRRLGARWDTGRAASLARRYGVPLPAPHRGGSRGYGAELSPREREVATLAASGRTNREIAADLYLSPKTVEKHISAVLRKLGVRSRTELARRFAGTGLGRIEDGGISP